MKIAAAQSTVTKGVTENSRTIRTLIHQAAKEGSRLVNFCEGALSGYAKAQITSPEDWQNFDWNAHNTELQAIAETCSENRIFAVIGSASPLPSPHPPLNSQYVINDHGEMIARYDKRYLSNSELDGWFAPGKHPIIFEVDGYRFGCLTCIEVQFPELFIEYERLDVDAVLFSSYGIGNFFQIALRAHAGFNCVWISGATPAQKAHHGSAGILGPDGKVVAHCSTEPTINWRLLYLTAKTPIMMAPSKRLAHGAGPQGRGRFMRTSKSIGIDRGGPRYFKMRLQLYLKNQATL